MNHRVLTAAVLLAMHLAVHAQTCPPEDPLEDNDTCATAFPLNFGSALGFAVFNGDPDYFTVNVPDATRIIVTMDYEPLVSPLELALNGPCLAGSSSGTLGFSETGSGIEVVSWPNLTGLPQPLIVRVTVPPGPWVPCNTYQLALGFEPVQLQPVGASYCASLPNSSGTAGTLRAYGADSVAANDLELVAAGLPGVSTVLLFDGTAPNMDVFFDGFRCVGGNVFRLATAFADGAGQSRTPLDLTSPPQPAGQILSGSTWYFQLWYRDPLGPAGFNLTDGVEITFQP